MGAAATAGPAREPIAPAPGAGSSAALIPCHRDPPTRALIAEIARHVTTVLLVDDGSPTASALELDRIADESGRGVLRLPANAGKGHAVAAGLRQLLSTSPAPDAVLVLDADGQHPPSLIPEFLRAARGAELVIGDRFGALEAMPRARRIANRLTSQLLGLITGKRVRDSQCGMRLLRGRALEIPFLGGGYEAETRHLKRCLRAGVTVGWVPIPAVYAGEASSFRAVRDGARVLAAVLRR